MSSPLTPCPPQKSSTAAWEGTSSSSNPRFSKPTSRRVPPGLAPGRRRASADNLAQSSIFAGIIYALTLTLVKLSILCLYIRVLTYEYARLAAKIVLGIVIVSHLWIILALCTICVPIDAFWDLSKRPTAYCHSMNVFWSHAGINIVTDFMIFVLPLTVLHRLRIPRRQKIALYLVFLVAFG